MKVIYPGPAVSKEAALVAQAHRFGIVFPATSEPVEIELQGLTEGECQQLLEVGLVAPLPERRSRLMESIVVTPEDAPAPPIAGRGRQKE